MEEKQDVFGLQQNEKGFVIIVLFLKGRRKMKQILEDLFDLPRTFLAWILFHLASWIDMKVIANDEAEDIFDDIWEELKDIEVEDIEDWDD